MGDPEGSQESGIFNETGEDRVRLYGSGEWLRIRMNSLVKADS